jgi:signal transduction histidine kinase
MVRISVIDQGPGIAPDQQAGLFERFYRVRSNADAPGVGLGLAIAKGIVDAHGGSIGIDSELGSGTSVWFTLPKASRSG